MGSLRFNRFLNTVADAGLELLRGRFLASTDEPELTADLCHALLSTLGEASGTALARDIVERYLVMDDDEKLSFFQFLRKDFGVDHDAALAAMDEYRKRRDADTLIDLAAIVEPRRQELLRRINMAPNGTATIIKMRRDLLRLVRQHPRLALIDADMKHLLSSWFNRGFLSLERINWETPAIILEKLIEHEIVHEMKGWEDLRGRLAEDRRCFAFFHQALPNEPLIFVEIALVKGLATTVGPIIDCARPVLNPAHADTAIFYSINNCLEGLQGILFGNFLIKQLVQELSLEFANIERFSTLSPIPGFRKWLRTAVEHPEQHAIMAEELGLLSNLEVDGWFEDSELMAPLKPLLLRMAACYFANARKGDEPLDSVARFHLRNGAQLERINWLGDCSENGLRQSAGMLVNYVYNPESIVENHERYVKDHVLAISADILDWVPRQLRRV